MMVRRLAVLSIAFFFALNAACGHSHPQNSDQASSNAQANSAKAAEGTPPPPGSPLAKIQVGMSDSEVRKILGDPDNSNLYPTGKGFIPFYYGPDRMRTDWMYKSKGRVVFEHLAGSGGMKVVRVDYNPNETAK